MPLYEYRCEACAHRFEVIQKFSDAPISVCPKCGGAVEKLLSSPAIQFKGSGFYLTDYGRGTGKTESASKSDKSDTATAKTDAKSDAKSETSKTDGGASASSSAQTASSAADTSSAKPTPKAD